MNTSPASLLIIHLLSADDQAEVGYVLQASSMGNATDGSAVMDRFVAKRSPSQSKSISIGWDVDGITFAMGGASKPPP